MAERPVITDAGRFQAAIDDLTDGVSRLVRQHFELARTEVRQEARQLATNLLVIAVFGAVALVGYGLLNLAVVFLFGAVWDFTAMAWATLALAVVNIGGAGIAIALGARRLSDTEVGLPDTTEELQKDREWIKEIRDNSSGELPTETH